LAKAALIFALIVLVLMMAERGLIIL